MKCDVAKVGIGFVIGWVLVKTLILVFTIITLPARIAFGILK
jgi:hypothetical protein